MRISNSHFVMKFCHLIEQDVVWMLLLFLAGEVIVVL